MKWLTDRLENRVKEVFESRYQRQLSHEDILEIAGCLVGLMEVVLKSEFSLKKVAKSSYNEHETNNNGSLF